MEAALLRHFEVLADQVGEQADRPDPGAALQQVLRTMIIRGSTKSTLASLLPEGSFSAPVRASSDRLRDQVAALLNRAQKAGAVRSDVQIEEIYLLVRALAQTTAISPADPATLDAAVTLVLAGLASPGLASPGLASPGFASPGFASPGR